MRKIIGALATCILLAGCSEEAPPQQEEQQQRAALTPGEYEATWTVSQLASSDDSTPATELAEGATGTVRACVGADGEIDPALFADAEDECSATSNFVRNGRISMQLECRRPGQPGQVLLTVNGTTTAEGFDAEVGTTTYFNAEGDYQMTRTVTGRRVGDCPAGEAAAANEAEADPAAGAGAE